MLRHIPFYSTLLGRELGNGKVATHSHVLVYGAIEAHSFGPSGCVASNKTMAADTGLNERTVANCVSLLGKSRWIAVNLDRNNHRTLITPLLELVAPSLSSEPPFTPELTPLHSPVNIDNSNKKTVRENTLVTKVTRTPKRPDPDIDLLVREFESTMNLKMPRAQYQRRAAHTLIGQRSLARTRAAIKAAAACREQPYSPKILTLEDLRDKWNDLEEFYRRVGREAQPKGVRIS